MFVLYLTARKKRRRTQVGPERKNFDPKDPQFGKNFLGECDGTTARVGAAGAITILGVVLLHAADIMNCGRAWTPSRARRFLVVFPIVLRVYGAIS